MKISKNKKKKLKRKAKKQQQLLEMQINQIEESERSGKPLMSVVSQLLTAWVNPAAAGTAWVNPAAAGTAYSPHRV